MRRATAGEVLKKAITVVVIVVLSLVAACAPAAPAPTPTPEPTPTPAWVPATKVEHMVGTWMGHFRWYEGVRYERFEADGTICYWYEGGAAAGGTWCPGRFWFEDGVYYEEDNHCPPVGSYRVYLAIEGGQAVGLRFEVIDDRDPACNWRRYARAAKWTRVDR